MNEKKQNISKINKRQSFLRRNKSTSKINKCKTCLLKTF